jgi:hypothetical protein
MQQDDGLSRMSRALRRDVAYRKGQGASSKTVHPAILLTEAFISMVADPRTPTKAVGASRSAHSKRTGAIQESHWTPGDGR